jgi:REP element-mobilizing transposase RayT
MPKQLEFKKVNGWGGKRKNAGRPNKTGEVSHGKRPHVNFKSPLHITMRLKKGMVNLRTQRLLNAFRKATREAQKFGFHVVHFSLLSNHVHLIAEAKNSKALASGMKSLNGRFGKAVRAFTGGRGRVFAGRFHLHVLKSPTEMKRALEYVLLNLAKHTKVIEHLDEFSTAFRFREWRALIGRRMNLLLEDLPEANGTYLSAPRSWLLTSGWKRAK